MILAQPRGNSVIETSISIDSYLRESFERDLFEGPLTDNEWSDAGDDGQNSEGEGLVGNGPRGNLCSELEGDRPEDSGALPSVKKRYEKLRKNNRRNVRRSAVQKARGTDLKMVALKHLRQSTVAPLLLDYDMAGDAAVVATGWSGKVKVMREAPSRAFSLKELMGEYELTLFKWDGRCVPDWLACVLFSCLLPRTPHLLLDQEKRIIGVLAGRPVDKGWDTVHDNAFTELSRVAHRARQGQKDSTPRRGIYASISHGISMGPGPTVRPLFAPVLQTRSLMQSTEAAPAQPGVSDEGGASGVTNG